MAVGILGVGYYVPGKILTNQDLINKYGPFYSNSSSEPKLINADDITTKTGIERRHIVTTEEGSDLAYQAAIGIIGNARVMPKDINCLIVTSSSPEMFFPSTACCTLKKLRSNFFPAMGQIPCYDLSAACAGSVYGLQTAYAYVASREYEYVLMIASEVMSKLCRWTEKDEDWKNSVLFGDMAGGVIIGNVSDCRGFLGFELATDAVLSEIARSDGFGTRNYTGNGPCIYMDGQLVYKRAIRAMVEGVENVVQKTGVKLKYVKRVILHQANGRMIGEIDQILQRRGLLPGRVPCNIANFGNTSSASVFSVLKEEVLAGNIEEGDFVAISVVGSGLTYGACLLRW